MAGDGTSDLREQLRADARGRVCLMGVGNLSMATTPSACVWQKNCSMPACRTWSLPETRPNATWVGSRADMEFDHLVFLDAVELGAAPGSVVFAGFRKR